MEKFNKIEYTKEYNKQHYKQFKTELKAGEKEELDKLLKENNLSKVEFIRKAKEKLERGRLIMKNTKYLIEWQIKGSDIVSSEEYDFKEDAVSEFERLKELNKNAPSSNKITEYRLYSVTYEIDEDGEPLDDGNFDELNYFETDKVL